MKKVFYIGMFMILGVLLSTLVHVALEFPALASISRNLSEGGESWLWNHWWLFHDIGGMVLLIVGLVLGFLAGKKYWRIVYVKKNPL
jgi:hypothetical protein